MSANRCTCEEKNVSRDPKISIMSVVILKIIETCPQNQVASKESKVYNILNNRYRVIYNIFKIENVGTIETFDIHIQSCIF